MPVDFGPEAPAEHGWPLDDILVIPTTIIGDELGRKAILDPAIRPIGTSPRVAGPAMTIACTAGDISGVLYGLEALRQGQIVMVDARAHETTAIWGEIMQTWATIGGAAGAVIDGAVRDSRFLEESPLAIYARAICPRGPLASGEGAVNRPISCGGVAVHAGDLVVADEDGIVVVRPEEVPNLVDRCRARIAFETGILEAVRDGESARVLFGLPDPIIRPLER